MKKPIIGITCPWSVETWHDDPFTGGYYYVGEPYANVIARFGGVPVLIPPEYKHVDMEEQIDTILQTVDGVFFTGGGHVKRLPGELVNPVLRLQQPIRYDFEAALMKEAFKRGKAILGICRGFQMILEVFGGSLSTEEVSGHKQTVPYPEPWHEVNLAPGSRLQTFLKTDRKNVNSIHVQRADRIPEGFIKSAWTDDGVAECVEYQGDKFVMGFQFHPEYLVRQNDEFGCIFEALMDAALKSREN